MRRKLPSYALKMNALCERFMGGVRRECLDHSLLLSEKVIRRVIREYYQSFNQARMQGIISTTVYRPETRVTDSARHEALTCR